MAFFDLIVKEAIGQDLENTELGVQHFVCARTRSFNKEFHNDFVLHELLDIRDKDSFVKRVSTEGTSHKECSRCSKQMRNTGNHH